jgi:hypothetical protein
MADGRMRRWDFVLQEGLVELLPASGHTPAASPTVDPARLTGPAGEGGPGRRM